MNIPVVIALALGVWMVVLILRGTWQERIVLVGAVVLGLMLPTVLDAAAELVQPALSSLSSVSF